MTGETTTSEALATTKPIAVICALEEELCHLRALLPAPTIAWKAGRRFEVTSLDDRAVILTRCGIGMLSAAAVAEATIGQWQPACILNYGCTGAHRHELLPGDIVIGARVVAYEHARFGPAQNLMRYLRNDEYERIDYLAADPMLLAAARRAADHCGDQHEPWPQELGWPASIPHRAPRVIVGTVASADRWNRHSDAIKAIVETHDSSCEDMEAGALALICASHAVPFLTIKDISNNELLEPSSEETFLTLLWTQLGRRAASLTYGTLQQMTAAQPG